jgi:hypothetical protein
MTYAGRYLDRYNRVFPEKKPEMSGDEAKLAKKVGKLLFSGRPSTQTYEHMKPGRSLFIYASQPPIVGWSV